MTPSEVQRALARIDEEAVSMAVNALRRFRRREASRRSEEVVAEELEEIAVRTPFL